MWRGPVGELTYSKMGRILQSINLTTRRLSPCVTTIPWSACFRNAVALSRPLGKAAAVWFGAGSTASGSAVDLRGLASTSLSSSASSICMVFGALASVSLLAAMLETVTQDMSTTEKGRMIGLDRTERPKVQGGSFTSSRGYRIHLMYTGPSTRLWRTVASAFGEAWLHLPAVLRGIRGNVDKGSVGLTRR
jgi:hypothetical protein